MTAWSAAVSARRRSHRHLELARAVFGEEGVRHHAGGAHRRDEAFAEGALAAEGIQAVGVAVALLVAGVDELLLERGDQAQAGRRIQCGDGAAQELARAAFPGRAVGVADVAEEEMLRRGVVGEIDAHLGGGIGHDHQIAGGAERRVEDRAECRLHQVGMRPADALAPPRIDFPRGKALAADVAGNIAGADEDQFLAQHGALLLPARLKRRRGNAGFRCLCACASAAQDAR